MRAPAAHNLPAPVTPLLGRARELAGAREALRHARLVTITGPGGVGKTRLALELARGQVGRRRDGVWLVGLATGPGPPDAPQEAARALGVRSPRSDGATKAVQAHLAGRDALVVLDNCEHVIASSAGLATALLEGCPGVRVLATSREPLGVAGEAVWPLEPLEPDAAFRLFVERARRRRPAFLPGGGADATIARLCDRVDRLPLAIELAAARVGAMSPAEILASLEDGLGDLGGGRRDGPAHHRTVWAAVEWSHRLLEPGEQAALRGLAVFAGSFDAAAATAVSPGLSPGVLTRLVDKSLVAAAGSGRGGATRYRLLETVRQFALEELEAAGGVDDARARHFAHFRALVDDAPAGWPSRRADQLVQDLREDYENVRAALEWSVEADPRAGLGMLAGAADLFLMLGQADGLRLARALLERAGGRDRSRALVQITAGVLTMVMAEPAGAHEVLEEARELSAELGEAELEGWAVFFAGLTQALGGRAEAAAGLLEASRELHRGAGSRVGEGAATAALGLARMTAGDLEAARGLAQEALDLQVAEGYPWGQGQAHVYLGLIAAADDAAEPSRATAHFRAAVEALRRYEDPTLLTVALVGQAGLLVRREPERALTVAAAASAARARSGGDFAPVFRERAERARAEAQARLGADAARVWAEGSRLGTDEAIGLAFGRTRHRPPAPSPTGLSARELDVAGLVAEGLANKEVAARLQLSVRTVESHVRHALAKLALDNRTQLATWARDHAPRRDQ